MSYLADSTLFLDYYRKSEKAKQYFERFKSGDITLSISVITEGEIWVGIKNDRELLYWMALMDLLESVEVNSNIARKAGEIYKNFGHYMGGKKNKNDFRFMGDAYIAATCYLLNKTLITRNYKHFKQLEERNMLICEKYDI
jgi:predicted nucleic acid-binding protein